MRSALTYGVALVAAATVCTTVGPWAESAFAGRGMLLNVTQLPTCLEEDASDLLSAPDGSSCRWDAAVAGLANGGNSFTATREGDVVVYTYDDGSRAYINFGDESPELLEVGDGWFPQAT